MLTTATFFTPYGKLNTENIALGVGAVLAFLSASSTIALQVLLSLGVLTITVPQ